MYLQANSQSLAELFLSDWIIFFSYGVESATWPNKGFEIKLMCDFSIPSKSDKAYFCGKLDQMLTLYYQDNFDENFITRRSFPLLQQNIPRYLMGSCPWDRWIIFTFQGKVLMKISRPGFIAFIASKYSNVPISRGQLVDPVVLVNNTSTIWTFQT